MELSYLAMKRFSAIALALLLVVAFSLPVSTLAAEESGIKPGSFFYGFVTTFEKINLFFTFSPEKKAEKALKYAEKRLAEAEAVAGDENSEAVKTAISGYEKNIALAAQASKKVKDETKAENLFNLIAENTSKHQEVLADVLTKVPEEAKEAIAKAIEASKKGQEEALKQVAELRGEVEKLKQEVADLKAKDEERGKIIEELSKQKPKNISIPDKPQISPDSETTQATKSATSPLPPEIPEEVMITTRQRYFWKHEGLVIDKYPQHYENISFLSFRVEAYGDEPTKIFGFVVEATGTMNPSFIKKVKILSGADRLLAEEIYTGVAIKLTMPVVDRYSEIEPKGSRDFIIVADFNNDLRTEREKTIGFSLKQILTSAPIILGDIPIESQFLTASTTKSF